jgi:hypothetical protein
MPDALLRSLSVLAGLSSLTLGLRRIPPDAQLAAADALVRLDGQSCAPFACRLSHPGHIRLRNALRPCGLRICDGYTLCSAIMPSMPD